MMQEGWLNLASQYNLDITISGIPAMTSYVFNSKNALKYKTLVTQEMLKKGFLASTNFYACTEHKDFHLESYFNALDGIYKKISDCEKKVLKIDKLLQGPVCHSGFKRLN